LNILVEDEKRKIIYSYYVLGWDEENISKVLAIDKDIINSVLSKYVKEYIS
jgi:DNA-binding transcriptional regulator LsrR (DeoR family)